MYHRYIKRFLGDEDGGRLFNKRGRWGRGRGSSRGRERGRGGYHHRPQQQEGGPWKNRRGRRHNNRGRRNSNSANKERDSMSTKSFPTKSEEKQLNASDEINPAESELGDELNTSVMSAIMADVATASAVAGTSNAQCSDNRQEIKIEKEESNNQSSDSGFVPVSQEGEKGEAKPQSSTACGGRVTAGSRKRKEMEGGRNKWGSRREAKPKTKKVIQIIIILIFNFGSSLMLFLSPVVGYGIGCCETE